MMDVKETKRQYFIYNSKFYPKMNICKHLSYCKTLNLNVTLQVPDGRPYEQGCRAGGLSPLVKILENSGGLSPLRCHVIENFSQVFLFCSGFANSFEFLCAMPGPYQRVSNPSR